MNSDMMTIRLDPVAARLLRGVDGVGEMAVAQALSRRAAAEAQPTPALPATALEMLDASGVPIAALGEPRPAARPGSPESGAASNGGATETYPAAPDEPLNSPVHPGGAGWGQGGRSSAPATSAGAGGGVYIAHYYARLPGDANANPYTRLGGGSGDG